jgi:hypothetical protein
VPVVPTPIDCSSASCFNDPGFACCFYQDGDCLFC